MTSCNGIKDLIEALKNIEGTKVRVNIGHKLYGDQNVECALRLVNDEERLGFLIGKQEIYLNKKEINNVGAKEDLWYFADNVMCIKIRKMQVAV